MGDIIQLKPVSRKAPDDRPSGWERRAEALKVALDKKAPFSANDQERAARNLHDLLEELEAAGIRKLDVVRRTGLGGEGTDSTKRLDTYTLPEGASERRRTILAKKPNRYFDFAKNIGLLRGESAVSWLCRIFEGCSFGTEAEFEDDWEERSWVTLAGQLSLMSESTIAKLDLEKFWQEVCRTEGTYDVRGGLFRESCDRLWILPLNRGLAGTVVCSDEAPPVPSVLLARRQMGDDHNGWMVLGSGERIALSLRYWLEIRLALAPGIQRNRVQGLIEFRTHLEGVTPDGMHVTFDNPFTDGSDLIRTAYMKGQQLPLQSLEFDYDSVPPAEHRHGSEHSYFGWEEISPGLLKREFNDLPQKSDSRPDRLAGVFLADLPPLRFPAGSLVARLQRELLHGATESELESEGQRIRDMFQRYQAQVRERVLASEAEAGSRWAAIIKEAKKQ